MAQHRSLAIGSERSEFLKTMVRQLFFFRQRVRLNVGRGLYQMYCGLDWGSAAAAPPCPKRPPLGPPARLKLKCAGPGLTDGVGVFAARSIARSSARSPKACATGSCRRSRPAATCWPAARCRYRFAGPVVDRFHCSHGQVAERCGSLVVALHTADGWAAAAAAGNPPQLSAEAALRQGAIPPPPSPHAAPRRASSSLR